MFIPAPLQLPGLVTTNATYKLAVIPHTIFQIPHGIFFFAFQESQSSLCELDKTTLNIVFDSFQFLTPSDILSEILLVV